MISQMKTTQYQAPFIKKDHPKTIQKLELIVSKLVFP